MYGNRAIPEGYMTVGEIARKMNTTVRTLQYYDREGLLKPSGMSEGGHRLYTDKDIIVLHQIQSMKQLGFSLDDINKRLVTLETPQQVADALAGQANVISDKIASLTSVLETINKLREETLQMQTVDFRRYADIVAMLSAGNEDYWVVKGIDDKLWNHIRNRFSDAQAKEYTDRQKALFAKAKKLVAAGAAPGSKQGLAIGKEWCEMLVELADGDMSLIIDLEKFGEQRDFWDDEWRNLWESVEDFIAASLEEYVRKLGYNPLENKK